MGAAIYSTDKIAFHPEALERLRRAQPQAPILVQWFLTNVCNQACGFCSYGSGPEATRAKVANPPRSLWKNQQLFASRDSLPQEKMLETVDSFVRMGVKAVEVTGGGEPTAYPHFDQLLDLLAATQIDFSLVTNGTLLSPDRVRRIAALRFVWARVSIDAGTPEDYVHTRHVPRAHWDKAWRAVELLATIRSGDTAVGVGFVIDRENWPSLYEACRLAREHGADNVRVSAAFTPDGLSRFDQQCFASVPEQIARAKCNFESPTFRIHDLSAERWSNVALGRQDYPFCYWKEVGCLIGADQNVYACCSLAYNKLGLVGSIREQSFEAMWTGEAAAWRLAHDPRRDCQVTCLYAKRNIRALHLMTDRADAATIAREETPPHVNFV